MPVAYPEQRRAGRLLLTCALVVGSRIAVFTVIRDVIQVETPVFHMETVKFLVVDIFLYVLVVQFDVQVFYAEIVVVPEIEVNAKQ